METDRVRTGACTSRWECRSARWATSRLRATVAPAAEARGVPPPRRLSPRRARPGTRVLGRRRAVDVHIRRVHDKGAGADQLLADVSGAHPPPGCAAHDPGAGVSSTSVTTTSSSGSGVVALGSAGRSGVRASFRRVSSASAMRQASSRSTPRGPDVRATGKADGGRRTPSPVVGRVRGGRSRGVARTDPRSWPGGSLEGSGRRGRSGAGGEREGCGERRDGEVLERHRVVAVHEGRQSACRPACLTAGDRRGAVPPEV